MGSVIDTDVTRPARLPRPTLRRRRPVHMCTVVLHVILIVVALIMVSPLVFALLASVTPLTQLLSRDGGVWPEQFEWSNYADAWTRANFGRYFVNSVLVTGGVVLLDTLVSSMTGYVLARRALRGQRFLEGLYVSTLFVGLTTATLYPQYQIADALGLGNLFGVTLVELTGVMLVHMFLIKAFVTGLGIEMEDAARVDGCGLFGTYWRITLLLMRPMLATTVILGFQASYNTVLAGASMALIPLVIVFIALQRFFVKGWTEGSVKG